MRVDYSPIFQKRFKWLSTQDKDAVVETIDFFKDHPDDPSLRNHLLAAPMSGKRSISVRDDLRIIFIERWNYVQVLILDVWDHLTVYGI